MSKPAFVFVGGVSHTPAFFENIISELAKSGHEAAAVRYPTLGYDAVNRGYQNEVKAIQDTVTDFVENQGKDVILVCHSYGGWPGSRAVKNWDKASREANGRKHGIVELVFIAAFLLPDNTETKLYSTLPDWITNEVKLSNSIPTTDNTTSHDDRLDITDWHAENGFRIPNEKNIPLLFSDLPSSAQRFWFEKFEPQRNDFDSHLTVLDAPWTLTGLPKTYIVCIDDKAAVVPFQFQMLQGVIDSSWCIKSIRAGHEPFLSQPEHLARLLLSASH